jgi:mRNA-degrading endonuclease toxin of MazEF toxin-antitoxin module
VSLDPTKGRGIRNAGPCVIVACRFQKRDGFVVLDRARLARRVGRLTGATLSRVLAVLQEMFAE